MSVMKGTVNKLLKPEYRMGFRVLRKEIGLGPTLRVGFSAAHKSRKHSFRAESSSDASEKQKNILKNHFKLLSHMYNELSTRFGKDRANEIMHEVLMEAGPVFMRGFAPIGSNGTLKDFISIYKAFESQNLVFDVIEESDQRFEIEVRRCLIYEAFKELGMDDLTKWMCDIAFLYFKSYHPKLKYTKDRMIARGDETCHEVFLWQENPSQETSLD
jgi:hypothetical protein